MSIQGLQRKKKNKKPTNLNNYKSPSPSLSEL